MFDKIIIIYFGVHAGLKNALAEGVVVDSTALIVIDNAVGQSVEDMRIRWTLGDAIALVIVGLEQSWGV